MDAPSSPTHTNSTLFPLQFASLRTRGWKPDYSSGATHDVALADTTIQVLEGKRQHHGLEDRLRLLLRLPCRLSQEVIACECVCVCVRQL